MEQLAQPRKHGLIQVFGDVEAASDATVDEEAGASSVVVVFTPAKADVVESCFGSILCAQGKKCIFQFAIVN
eukprot:scaffold36203_cov33-Prasinocladus_malaysianus.AAC.1